MQASGLQQLQVFQYFWLDYKSISDRIFSACVLSETDAGIFRQILHGKIDFETLPWPSISEGAKDLIRKMLVKDPKKRLTAYQVLSKT